MPSDTGSSPAPTSDSALAEDGTPAEMPTSWDLVGPLASVDDARAATPSDLSAAALELLATAAGVATDPGDRRLVEATGAGPVTVASVRLDRDRVEASLAILVPDAPAEVVLRTLAASSAVGPSAARTEVTATVAGEPVDARVEPDRDRIVVDLGEARPDGVVLGLDLAYEVPAADDLAAGGGPGAYGLLADHGGVVTLGHWLPAAVAVPGNDGDVPAWGDLGAFDAGTWIVDVAVDGGALRTGGVDRTTPAGTQRAIGVGLRDLAAAWFPEGVVPAVAAGPVDGTGADEDGDDAAGDDAVVLAASGTGASDQAMADLGADQLDVLGSQWGPLPWPEFDLVRAPILPAAGMEFPGLVLMDDDYWRAEATDTRFVLAHELGHQYAHALVGNGSLSDPVVDEPLAQYLAYRWFLAVDGEAFADDFAMRTFADDFDMVREAPGQSAADFASDQAYSVAIYRTAADAWYQAGVDHGVDVVDRAVRAVLTDHALREVDEDAMLDSVEAVSPDVAADLRAAFDQAPG